MKVFFLSRTVPPSQPFPRSELTRYGNGAKTTYSRCESQTGSPQSRLIIASDWTVFLEGSTCLNMIILLIILSLYIISSFCFLMLNLLMSLFFLLISLPLSSYFSLLFSLSPCLFSTILSYFLSVLISSYFRLYSLSPCLVRIFPFYYLSPLFFPFPSFKCGSCGCVSSRRR